MSFIGSLLRTKSIEQSIADTTEPGHRLKRSLSAWDLMILGVAVAVGAGIFSVGARAAGDFAGPAVSVSFVLAALTCALAIMCYAEFASTIPVAGSAYTYTYATFGEFLAWIIGWDLILELLTAAAVIAKYWGIYLATVFDLFDVHVATTLQLGAISMDWAPLLVVSVFTWLLIAGTQLSARVNNVFTIIKVGIVLLVIVVGFTYMDPANFTPFVPASEPTTGGAADVWAQSLLSWATGEAPAKFGIGGVVSGAALVFFAFVGFDVVATSAEEVKDPQRTLPRGIFGGLILVTILYVLVALALTGMVPYTVLEAAENPSLATAFIAVGAEWAAQAISVGILVGLTTVILVLLMGLSRVLLAMSRDGLLPRWLSVTSDKRGTPVRLQLVCGAMVALLAGFTQVEILEEMSNIGTLSAFVLVSIGVVILRRRRPDLPRAYRVPFSPVVPIVSALLCLYLMLNLTTLTWVRFAVWLVVGVAIYFAYGRSHSRVGLRERGL